MIKIIPLMLLPLFFFSYSYAEIYKWIDEKGTMHFSDLPPEKNEYSVEKKAVSPSQTNEASSIKSSKTSDLTSDDIKFLKDLSKFNSYYNGGKILSEAELNEAIKASIDSGVTHKQVEQLKVMYAETDISLASQPPNPNFSSPEKTWDLYKSSLINGNLDSALTCLEFTEAKEQKEIFKALGKEKMKKMGEGMQQIQKITQDEQTAKYRIRRQEKGQEITYYIYFSNIFGNWKIDKF